jgi:hypothetical protein
MRLHKAWIVTLKDLAIFKKNRYVLYSLIAMPVILGVVLPLVYLLGIQSAQSSMTPTEFMASVDVIINLVSTFLIMVPAILPS